MEVQISATALRVLATDPTTPADWAGVVADLAHQLDHDAPADNRYRADVDRRFPGAGLGRYLEIRDRSCVMIGCRAPAHTTDKDHTLDYTHGGPTVALNLGAACRHDHRLKAKAAGHSTSPDQGCSVGRTNHPHATPDPHHNPSPSPEPKDDPPPF